MLHIAGVFSHARWDDHGRDGGQLDVRQAIEPQPNVGVGDDVELAAGPAHTISAKGP